MARPRVNASAPQRTKEWLAEYALFRKGMDLWLYVQCHMRSKSTADFELSESMYGCLKSIDADMCRCFITFRRGDFESPLYAEVVPGYEYSPCIQSAGLNGVKVGLESALLKLWSNLTRGVTGRGCVVFPKGKDLRKAAAAYVKTRRLAIRLRTRGFVSRPKKRSAKNSPPFVLVVDGQASTVDVRFIGDLKSRSSITLRLSSIGKNNWELLKAIMQTREPVVIAKAMNLDDADASFRKTQRPVLTYSQICGRQASARAVNASKDRTDENEGDGISTETYSERSGLDFIEVAHTKTDRIRQRVKRFQEFWEKQANIGKVSLLVPTELTRKGLLRDKTTASPRGWLVNVLVLVALDLEASDA